MSEEAPAGLSVKTSFGEANLFGKDLSTIATFITPLLVLVLTYWTWQQSIALREMTQAIREHTCMISIPEAQREQKADFCKRITK